MQQGVGRAGDLQRLQPVLDRQHSRLFVKEDAERPWIGGLGGFGDQVFLGARAAVRFFDENRGVSLEEPCGPL